MVIISTSNANLSSDAWHHVGFTYNRLTSNASVFVDDKIVSSANDVHIDLTKSEANYTIGYSSNQDGEKRFTGAVDDVAVYNRELNTDEISYLANSNQQQDLFLKNQLVADWSFKSFSAQTTSFDNQGATESAMTKVSGGAVTQGSTLPIEGSGSIALDGTTAYTAPNSSLDSSFMSVGAWVKPTAHGGTIIEKEGVFSLGTDSTGKPTFSVGGVDVKNENTRFVKNTASAPVPKSRFLFQDSLQDTMGNADASAKGTNYVAATHTSDNTNRSIALQNTDSEINAGDILTKTDPNQMTLGMWVNLSELQEGKRYPLMSANNGFEWYVENDGTGKLKVNFAPSTATLSRAEIKSFVKSEDGESATVTVFANATVSRDVSVVMTTERVDTETSDGIKALKQFSSGVCQPSCFRSW